MDLHVTMDLQGIMYWVQGTMYIGLTSSHGLTGNYVLGTGNYVMLDF